MTTMVERVAQAIAEELGENWEKPTIFMLECKDTHETCRETYRAMARAAIEAMREPTEEMFEAVDCGGERKQWNSGRMHRASYQGMVDGALRGGKTIDGNAVAGMIEGGADAD